MFAKFSTKTQKNTTEIAKQILFSYPNCFFTYFKLFQRKNLESDWRREKRENEKSKVKESCNDF